MTAQSGARLIRLRFPGRCARCGIQLDAGTMAEHDPVAKTVRCSGCFDLRAEEIETRQPGEPAEVLEESLVVDQVSPAAERGVAGQSARREHERRRAKRENAVRSAHPRLGRLMLAVSEEPQSTAAWARGAVGEEKLGARLDSLVSSQIQVLHDRRIPKTVANIDHIVVCPSGVVVIDAKRYQGRPTLQTHGGLFSPRVEKLVVGRRDCSKLVDGVLKQVDLVRRALQEGADTDVNVRGMLCFIDADWPLIGGSFTIRGVDVLWAEKAAEILKRPGPLTTSQVSNVAEHLSRSFSTA